MTDVIFNSSDIKTQRIKKVTLKQIEKLLTNSKKTQ